MVEFITFTHFRSILSRRRTLADLFACAFPSRGDRGADEGDRPFVSPPCMRSSKACWPGRSYAPPRPPDACPVHSRICITEQLVYRHAPYRHSCDLAHIQQVARTSKQARRAGGCRASGGRRGVPGMTVKLVVLYPAPDDPDVFDHHYFDTYAPLVKAFRVCRASRPAAAYASRARGDERAGGRRYRGRTRRHDAVVVVPAVLGVRGRVRVHLRGPGALHRSGSVRR
jgi:hypothetical protein